MRFLKHHNFTR